MSDANKEIVRRLYDEGVNAGNLDLFDELIHPDFVDHEAFPEAPPGVEGVKQLFTMFRSAFPDLKFVVEDMIAEGDTVAARASMQGTHEGEFQGIAATGKSINVPLVDFLRLADGKVVEHWGLTGDLALLEQLGAAPA